VKSEQTDNGLIGKAWELQHNLETRQKRIGRGKYGRVLKMARKPTPDEYHKSSLITGIGILLVGGLGFLIWVVATQIAPLIANFFSNM
jgi:protein transport protein SEC61 subunit gamma-like protein